MKRTGSPTDGRLAELIGSEGDLAVTEPVLMEVLAGARDEQAATQLRRLLTSFEWIPADSSADFEGAARVYRVCRTAGFAPRGMIDCMVASIALRSGSTVLAADRDFEQMAAILPLQVDRA